MRFTKLLMSMLPTVEPWVVPGENVDNPGGIPNVNPLDTLSSDLHEWGGRVRFLTHGIHTIHSAEDTKAHTADVDSLVAFC